MIASGQVRAVPLVWCGSDVDGVFLNMNLHYIGVCIFNVFGKSAPKQRDTPLASNIKTFITVIYYIIILYYYHPFVVSTSSTPQAEDAKHLSIKTIFKGLVGESIKSSFSMKINQCLIMFCKG